ncbi:S1 family serine peptidase [Lentzea sp. NPDC051213]|uniref:S1 family serine peptidase n=1 Tax=Lentzea sp. NPDC051213 TaxID=3364126 RepID=UPI0037A9A904
MTNLRRSFAVAAAVVAGLAAQVAPASAIVGGQQAAVGQFRSVVSIVAAGWQGDEHKCSGVLLGTRSVLTTAGCVDGHTAGDLKVKYDGTDRTTLRTTNNVTKVDQHAEYDPSTGRRNVAVLVLADPILTSDTVDTAELPLPVLNDPAPGSRVHLAGWGKTQRGNAGLPTQLQHADLPVISRAACNTAYGAGSITTGMFCAKAQVAKFACEGDAGSPVLVGNRVVGLVTAKNGCTHPGKPDVYVRTGAFELWILSHVR